jgi:energy-coupling factor transporter ATP-binding protein EcfA2
MDDALRRIVYEQLTQDGWLELSWSVYLIAACEGAEELEAVLTGSAPPSQPAPASSEAPAPQHSYLGSITVQGFRGIGPERTLKLDPGPGLTLVIGRNGTGKSSFAEALEILLTGDNKRWSKRSGVWKEGWRNLHHPNPALVEAEVFVDGAKGPIRITRAWDEDAVLEASKVEVAAPSKPRQSLDSLGWTDVLISYRPFLSYNEMGAMLEGKPSELYDAVAPILGLEDLTDAQKTLADARLTRERAFKTLKQDLPLYQDRLQELAKDAADERATGALECLDGPWNLDRLEQILVGSLDAGIDLGAISVLQQLVSLRLPAEDQILQARSNLRTAAANIERLQGSNAQRAGQVADLLERSLSFHEQHGDKDCPVCGTGGVLGSSWAKGARHHIEELRRQAEESTRANEGLVVAVRFARSLITAPPSSVKEASSVNLDASAVEQLWERWGSAATEDDPLELANHLESFADPLRFAVDDLIEAAARELRAREDRWRPVALDLSDWLVQARRAMTEVGQTGDLKAAEEWLKKATADIRTERFAPIESKAQAIWSLLRQQSNVQLGGVQLSGTRQRRTVVLDVTIDGAAGSALGVMSQGELSALALSLFLPRATSDESPFGFIVIDDPVQSMDPARVDGLARVLEEVAGTHQVVVFTHDARLAESVRWLQIPARFIEVTRRANSVVDLREAKDPVTAHLEDARAVALTKEMPEKIKATVVAGFCRTALEAAFTEVVRRRRITRGEPHAEVEEALAGAKLTTLAAMALFDDGTRGGDVMRRLNQFGGWAGTTFKTCKDGAHGGFVGDILGLARDTEALTGQMVTLR